jgi:hypothetical protein
MAKHHLIYIRHSLFCPCTKQIKHELHLKTNTGHSKVSEYVFSLGVKMAQRYSDLLGWRDFSPKMM